MKIPNSLNRQTLQHLTTSLGLPTTGTKPVLRAHLESIAAGGLHNAVSGITSPTSGFVPLTPSDRILSIDLGIRNFAYCLVSPVNSLTTSGQNSRSKVRVWNRLALHAKSLHQDPPTPATVRALALPLLMETLLPLRPTHILLEMQRWRSGGAASVLHTTVLVNTLETALIVALGTLAAVGVRPYGNSSKAGGEKFVPGCDYKSIHSINPRRVVDFFTRLQPTNTSPPKDSKSTKAMKIDLVRTWLANNAFDLSPDASLTANLFNGSRTRSVARSGAEEVDDEGLRPGKLDDVADCLVQAVAWVRWQENRALLAGGGIDGLMERVGRG